jgi:hypothetical protein
MRAHDEALPGNEYKMRMWDTGSSADLDVAGVRLRGDSDDEAGCFRIL